MFLEIHDLKKSFGSGNNRTEVLKGIEFTANKGEILILLEELIHRMMVT